LFGGEIYFQHDNTKSHIPKIVTVKIAELGRELLPYSPYSQDLAPSDYHLFFGLSNHLRGKNFENKRILMFFSSKPPEFYAKRIHDLSRRWAEFIEIIGEYILDI